MNGPLKLLVSLVTIGAISLPALSAIPGDPALGKQEYVTCGGCHSLDRDRTGPRHCGILNRPAGSVEGFRYSTAMKSSGLVWDPPTLDRFIEAPLEVVPGTAMGFAGIKDDERRANLIAYLIRASESKAVCNGAGKSDK